MFVAGVGEVLGVVDAFLTAPVLAVVLVFCVAFAFFNSFLLFWYEAAGEGELPPHVEIFLYDDYVL